MFRDLLMIIFQPKRTLDRLFFEENMRNSWLATVLMALLGILTTLLNYWSKYSSNNKDIELGAKSVRAGNFMYQPSHVASVIVALVVISFAIPVLGRYFFSWFVRIGLRMVAGSSYTTQSLEERRANGKKLQVIHPYAIGVNMLPALILMVIPVLLFGNKSATEMAMQGETGTMIAMSIVNIVVGLATLGTFIYSIVVKVLAIRKIYNVSGAQAFWGPFLSYVLAWVAVTVPGIIAFIIVIAATIKI